MFCLSWFTAYTLHVLHYSLKECQVGILSLTKHFGTIHWKFFQRLPYVLLSGGYVKDQDY